MLMLVILRVRCVCFVLFSLLDCSLLLLLLFLALAEIVGRYYDNKFEGVLWYDFMV